MRLPSSINENLSGNAETEVSDLCRNAVRLLRFNEGCVTVNMLCCSRHFRLLASYRIIWDFYFLFFLDEARHVGPLTEENKTCRDQLAESGLTVAVAQNDIWKRRFPTPCISLMTETRRLARFKDVHALEELVNSWYVCQTGQLTWPPITSLKRNVWNVSWWTSNNKSVTFALCCWV